MYDGNDAEHRPTDATGTGPEVTYEQWCSQVPQLTHSFEDRLDMDPVAVAAQLARADLGRQYIVYEREGVWHFAAGPSVEASVTADTLRLRVGEWEQTIPIDDPIGAIEAAVCQLRQTERVRCYGWVAFELAYLLHGGRSVADSDPLIHVMVPAVDVELGDGRICVHATTATLLDRTVAVLQETATAPETVPIPLLDDTPDRYTQIVDEVVERINGRQLDKAVLSRMVPLPDHPRIDLPATYVAGRRANTPARSFMLRLGSWSAVGFSPETVVEVAADGRVRTQPLAGTRALHPDPETNQRVRADLLSDPKEIHEHAISVRLALEEVRAVSSEGTVSVTEFMEIEERGSVQHLASRVVGTLRAAESPWTALASLFPAVTVTGAPKANALRLIDELEEDERGLYGGAVLMLEPDGGLDAALTLRTVFHRNGRSWLRAGAGIMGQSTPDREWEETREKLSSIAPHLRGTIHDEDTR